MQETNTLILEILKLDDALKMGIYEQSQASSTLRHYSQCRVFFPEVEKICQEISSVLNKTDRQGSLDPVLFKRLTKSGQLLWDHLLAPSVKNKLKSARSQDLILSLDEELVNVPWELLYDGSNFLCLGFNLGRLVRTRKEPDTVQYRGFALTPKMLILANPTSDLKSAYLEGLNIRNQFDRKRSSVHIDFKSTAIEKIYVKKNLRDYDLVHFAGHCEYDPHDLQESGWVLADGKFTVADILNTGSSVSLPSLIFSNACYSASGSADLLTGDYQERIYTLAQAFLFSGVRHYIGSIRRIEDQVSLSFAKEFYFHLISGKSVGESMRLGRLKLIKEYGILSVAWAGYLLYGDPNFVLFRSKSAAAEQKKKKRPLMLKRKLAWATVPVIIITVAIFLYMWLPSLNPGTYYLYLSSKKGFLQGRNEKVISLSKRIIQKEPGFLAAYPLLGDTYHRLGNKEASLKAYFDYALFSENAKDNKNLLSAYIGLGWLYHLQGNYEKAAEFYDKALSLSRLTRNKLTEADVLGKQAIWHMDKGDNDKALELLTKSTSINRERQNIYKHRYNLACDYFNLGLLFTNKDDFVTAKEFYAKSFKIFSALRLTHELSDYYFNMGEIYSYQKEYAKALDSYQRGLAIDRKQGNRFNFPGDYDMIGELYMAMDNPSEAEKYFRESIEAAEAIDSLPELASAYHNLGLLYKAANKKSKAREYLRLAQEIYSRIDKAKYEEIREEFLALNN